VSIFCLFVYRLQPCPAIPNDELPAYSLRTDRRYSASYRGRVQGMNIIKVDFDSYLDTREIADGVWELLQDFTVFIHSDDKTFEVIIRKGFVSDMASVPRIPFAYLMYGGIGNYAAVLHDGLYSNSSLVTIVDFDNDMLFHPSREWCDYAFYLGLLERNISTFKAKMMYWAVRWQGGKYYQRKL
jgi:hypothetical protein